MKELEPSLAWALYESTVADRENIRKSVLDAAHQEMGTVPTVADRTKKAHRSPARFAMGTLAACVTFCLFLNVSAPFAAAVSHVPVLSAVARLVTFRQWDFANESADIHGETPAVQDTGNAELETSLNALIDEKVSALDEKARADAAEYRENWLAMGNQESDFVPIQYAFDYETYSTTGGILSFVIRQQETITTDTVDTYTTLYYYNLDIASGRDLTLADLLGANWASVVADAVDTAIRESGDERGISFYQEFWVDKQVPVDESQLFYVAADGSVTVVFDEGVIAPYEDGPQSFVVRHVS